MSNPTDRFRSTLDHMHRINRPLKAKFGDSNPAFTITPEQVLAAETVDDRTADDPPTNTIEYRTPVGTFTDWLRAADWCEAHDLDPVMCIEIVRKPIAERS